MKPKLGIVMGLFILCLSLAPIGNVLGITWVLSDEINDVQYYNNNDSEELDDNRKEIDIVEVKLDQPNIEILFKDTPIDDSYHVYQLIVYWDLTVPDTIEPFANVTRGQIGGEENWIETIQYNSTGFELTHIIVNDSITIERKTIVMPVPNYNLLSAIQSPFVEFNATFEPNEHEYYYDNVNGSDVTSKFGFGSIAIITTFASTLFIACCLTIIKKRKD